MFIPLYNITNPEVGPSAPLLSTLIGEGRQLAPPIHRSLIHLFCVLSVLILAGFSLIFIASGLILVALVLILVALSGSALQKMDEMTFLV